MSFNAIPAELKARVQWVVWKFVMSDGRMTKPPFQARRPQYEASVTRPETWATFEEAVACVARGDAQGIGYVFSDTDDYFGIDIDDEGKVEPDDLPVRRDFVTQILSTVKTYTEVSPSGTGLHLIAKGKMSERGKRSTRLQIELYGSGRYFTMTGHVFDNRFEITYQQEFLTEFYNSLTAQGSAPSQPAPSDIDAHRRVDLSDEEVVRLATNYHPQFAARLNAQLGCEPGRWSETFMAVIGTLDRFTGVVAQVERIIMSSPLVLNAPASNAGETRLSKAQRNFNHVLQRVRAGNNGQLHFVEHGRAIFEAIQRAQAERAQEAAEALRQADEAIAGADILAAFPMLTDAHKSLMRPPGVIGEFVEATEGAMHHPFTKYAIPATVAALAGVVARGYKLPGGGGLNVNFILAAPSSTGKTQTMEAWDGFMTEAAAALGNTLAGQSRSRILSQGTSSIQGIFEDFMATPSLCWSIEECAAQLRSMSEANSPTEIQLRDSYNAIFDASRHGKWFTPPRSVANRKANITPINNLSVSTYWSTTDSKFDVFSADALDGFLSRVSVIRHKGPAGPLCHDAQSNLSSRLKQVLVTLLGAAKKLDETYEIDISGAGALITTVSIEAVYHLSRSIMEIVERVKNAALTGELPPAYTAISRLPITALRIAAICAVVENPFTPNITADQYLWAFGYLLQNTLALLGSMDQGELGSKAADDTLAVARAVRSLLKKSKGAPGVAKNELRRYLIGHTPFCNMNMPGRSASKHITDLFDHMVKEGMLEEIVDPTQQGRGRPRSLLCPTNDPIWK